MLKAEPAALSVSSSRELQVRPASAACSNVSSRAPSELIDAPSRHFSFRPHTAGVTPPALPPPSGKPDLKQDDFLHVLFMHCCAVAALSSMLPEDADVGPDSLRNAMQLFENTARRRVRAVTHLAPINALSTLTQLFIFEGLSCREERAAAQRRQREKLVSDLQQSHRELETKLGESQEVIQSLREAMLQVQTQANRQVLEARDENLLLKRDAYAQAAEVRKLSVTCEKLKAQLEAASTKVDVTHRDSVWQTYGDLIPSKRSALFGVAVPRASLGKDKDRGDELRSKQRSSVPSVLPNGHGIKSPPQQSNGTAHRNSRVGFTPEDPQSPMKTPSFSRAESFRRSVSTVADSQNAFESQALSTIISSSKEPQVQSEAYVEAVYMYLGGTPDKQGKLDPKTVREYLEKSYDSFSDPERFARLLRRYKSISLAELAVILLQLAKT